MNELKIFDYGDCPITFEMKGENIMANATQMASMFNKRPNDYFNLLSTKELIKVITNKNGIAENQLVVTKRGGLEGSGTWIHEDLLIDFAQWLSVEFRVWVSDRIKELMKHGITATNQTIEQMIADPEFAIKTLTALKEERQLRLDAEIKNAALMHSNKLCNSSEIAKECNMKSAQQLNNFLASEGVQFKSNGTWLLYSKYSNCGYVSIKQDILDSGVIIYDRKFTQIGRDFILSLINKTR